MLKRNEDIRNAKGKIPAWIIAEKLGIHEKTFYSWMRYEMSEKKKKLVLKAIEEAKNELRLSRKAKEENRLDHT